MALFNVRVYGILLVDDCVVVTDEITRGGKFTKLPGGGLEFGEGTRDCLKREFLEEMDLEVEIGDHIYTTDFFQMSAFNKEQQIISIYYYAEAVGEPDSYRAKIHFNEKPFDFSPAQMEKYKATGETETFRLIPKATFNANDMHLPIDKVVATMLREEWDGIHF
jgi:ADP-ribose pyrophosphatase YjhB (NUDIX family)